MTFALYSIIHFDDRNYVFEFLCIKELNHCHHTSPAKTSKHFLKQKCGNPACGWLGDKEATHVNPVFMIGAQTSCPPSVLPSGT